MNRNRQDRPHGIRMPSAMLAEIDAAGAGDTFKQARNMSRKDMRRQKREEKKHGGSHKRPKSLREDELDDFFGDEHDEPVPKKQAMSAAQTMDALKAKKQKIKQPTKPIKAPPSSLELQMAKDELEMEFYAKKLGLKSYKLPSADDGLDDLLGDLDFDEFASSDDEQKEDFFADGNKKDVQKKDSDDFVLDEDDQDEEDDENGEDDEDDEDEEDEDDDVEDNEEEFTGFDDIPDVKTSIKIQKTGAKENPYIAPAAGKYIPPSKRQLQDSTLSEQELQLQKQVKGLLNRLSEANITNIVGELERIYQNGPRGIVSGVITSVIIESTASQGALLDSFLLVHAALVCALFRVVGVEFGAAFVQTLVESFDKYKSSTQSSNKEAVNLLALMSELYTFQMVSCKLIYDLIREFLGSLDEVATEFLLKLIRSCGQRLRTDDPAALKDIVALLQQNMVRLDQSKVSVRTKFLVETITALKNNRQKATSETAMEITGRLKKVLGQLQSRDPLGVSLDDIRNVDTKGKWWIVGAAWKNQQATMPKREITSSSEADSETNLLALAKANRMNTDVRRAIFVALMGADDYVDAHERLSQLQLPNKQEREVPRVILHCCTSESVYNPYYALVAGLLCAKHTLRKAFDFCLWDFLENVEDGTMAKEIKNRDIVLKRTIHMAKLYAHLTAEGRLTLDLLKTVNFASAIPETQVFLDMFMTELLQAMAKAAEAGDIKTKKIGFGSNLFGTARDEAPLLQMLAKVKDAQILRAMQAYLTKMDAPALVTSKKRVERVKWGISICIQALEDIIARR